MPNASAKCINIYVIITGSHKNINCWLIFFSCPQIYSLSGSAWQEVPVPLGTWKRGIQTCTCLPILKRFRKPSLKVSKYEITHAASASSSCHLHSVCVSLMSNKQYTFHLYRCLQETINIMLINIIFIGITTFSCLKRFQSIWIIILYAI